MLKSVLLGRNNAFVFTQRPDVRAQELCTTQKCPSQIKGLLACLIELCVFRLQGVAGGVVSSVWAQNPVNVEQK